MKIVQRKIKLIGLSRRELNLSTIILLQSSNMLHWFYVWSFSQLMTLNCSWTVCKLFWSNDFSEGTDHQCTTQLFLLITYPPILREEGNKVELIIGSFSTFFLLLIWFKVAAKNRLLWQLVSFLLTFRIIWWNCERLPLTMRTIISKSPSF